MEFPESPIEKRMMNYLTENKEAVRDAMFDLQIFGDFANNLEQVVQRFTVVRLLHLYCEPGRPRNTELREIRS